MQLHPNKRPCLQNLVCPKLTETSDLDDPSGLPNLRNPVAQPASSGVTQTYHSRLVSYEEWAALELMVGERSSHHLMLFPHLSQRRFANSLVKLGGQSHMLSPNNKTTHRVFKASKLKTHLQKLKQTSNCTTASGKQKESCLRHNFPQKALPTAPRLA